MIFKEDNITPNPLAAKKKENKLKYFIGKF